jgi:rod shape-determining protein MreC
VALVEIKQRSGYLFLAVLLGHMLLISMQINSRTGVPVLEAVASGVFAEAERAVTSLVSGVARVWNGYIGLRHVKTENDELRRQLATTEVELQEQRALADRTRGLERLLDLRDHSDLQTLPAEIIAGGASPDFRTLTIDRGSRDGLHADMAVLAAAGVVGRIVVPTLRSAKVQLLVDRNGAAGALIERSRAQGVVVGRGDNRLELQYVSEVADIVVGDTLVTSGIDGIFPKGFVIGSVESIDRTGGGFKHIVVRPAVDFSSLEEVLVVVTPTPAQEAAGKGGE